MTQPPILTDRVALARNRARATRRGLADFLHRLAIDDVKERLETVNRSFTDVAVVTGFPRTWQAAFPGARMVADDEVLDLSVGAHDLVIHGMALHWANDPVGQLVQCRRALRPDGLLIALTFGGQTLHELRAVLTEAEAEVTGGLSPRIVPMGDIRDLGGLLQRAGLALPVADSITQRVAYRDMAHLMTDLRAMGEANALAERLRRPTRRTILQRAAARFAECTDSEGRIAATFEIIVLTGWAAHSSQQRPLRPGSALNRLADALNTAEIPLPKAPFGS